MYGYTSYKPKFGRKSHRARSKDRKESATYTANQELRKLARSLGSFGTRTADEAEFWNRRETPRTNAFLTDYWRATWEGSV
jgi:hypothetical protein